MHHRTQLLSRLLVSLCTCEVQGGCGLRNAIHASLRSAPLLYTVTLAWPGALAPQQDIGAVLTFVQSSIDLGLVYPGALTR